MSGYTGNANTPPSVLNKMFNTGVLGQTPAFVPGSGDMGASRTGSRNSIPNTLGLGGSVGGPPFRPSERKLYRWNNLNVPCTMVY